MMLFLETVTIMGIFMLLIGILSLLVAMTTIRTHWSAKAYFFSGFMELFFGSFLLYKAFIKLFGFTTPDWIIIVGLVLAALILVVIIYWVLFRRKKVKAGVK